VSKALNSDVLLQPQGPGFDIGAGRFPEVKENEIALMFSGGVDSTATAIMLAEKYDKVHLITYRNGYGHYYHHRTKKRVDELNKALGDPFVFTLVSTKDYFDEIVVNSVLKDFKKYKSGFIWFMGCKMAMHMRSAIYCMENGLRFMSDGSNEDTNEMVEQMLVSLTLIRFFYDHYGIQFGTPVYEISRDESRNLIKKLKLNMGIQVMDRHLCIQPTCIAGELYYMPYLLFNKKVKHDESVISQFIEEKQRICDAIIQRHFDGKGVKLEELIADRQAQLAALSEPKAAGAKG
jgi:predicted subunit of tRNA(5-methylaminomethyl-2-thiouridylate) methyltransferase